MLEDVYWFWLFFAATCAVIAPVSAFVAGFLSRNCASPWIDWPSAGLGRSNVQRDYAALNTSVARLIFLPIAIFCSIYVVWFLSPRSFAALSDSALYVAAAVCITCFALCLWKIRSGKFNISPGDQ